MSEWGYQNGSYPTYSSWSESATSHPQPQHEYNPDFPSLAGTTYIVPFTTQGSYPASYFPSKQGSRQAQGKRTFPKKNQQQNRPNPNIKPIPPQPVKKPVAVPLVKPKPPSTPTPKASGTAPNSSVKVARVKNQRGAKKHAIVKRENSKMPHYAGLEMNGWGTSWIDGSSGSGAGRGGSKGGRGRGGGRYNNNRKPRARKPNNTKEDIPFLPLSDDDAAISLTCSAENIVAFHGFDSVFTTQHKFPVLIDGKIYQSCDHYYQIRKVLELTGSISDQLNQTVRDQSGKYQGTSAEGSAKTSYNAITKEAIKSAGIAKEKVDEWRVTKGLEAIQTAMLAKVSQSAHLREALKETGDQIIVQAYAGDSIYGTGCTVIKIRKWLEELVKSGVKTLKIPAEFPLTQESVKKCPGFADGRNILGVILMQLRNRVRENRVEIVDMSSVFDALRVSDTAAPVAMEVGSGDSNGFKLGATTPGTF